MTEATHASEAQRRWRLVRTVFFGDAPAKPATHQFKKPKSRARARWSFVRRAFQIDASEMRKAAMPSNQDAEKVEPDILETSENPLEVKTSGVDKEVEDIVRETSLTAVDSPYRSALSTLASIDWQYSGADGRNTPSHHALPQVSMVRYQPNHEAFFDEDAGHPIAKISTRSFKNPAAFLYNSSLADVREDMPQRPSVHDFYSRKRRIPSFRLKNIRFTISQTLSRYLRSCTHPDVKV